MSGWLILMFIGLGLMFWLDIQNDNLKASIRESDRRAQQTRHDEIIRAIEAAGER